MLKRFASTTSAGSATTAYLPSVSWLIHKHKLSDSIVSTIPTSGPKNRLLKGDVLAFLQGGGGGEVDLEALLSSETYHSIPVHISSPSKKSISEIGNIVAVAALAELHGKNGLSPLSHASIITKQSLFGDSVDYSVETSAEPTNITSSLLSNLKAHSDSLTPAPGSFRLIDSLSLGDRFNDTIHHISSGEAAILSISRAESTGISSSSVDIFDILSNKSASPHLEPTHGDHGDASSTADRDQDLLDFLSSAPAKRSVSHQSILLELVVDSRKVSDKAAAAYLVKVKQVVESKL